MRQARFSDAEIDAYLGNVRSNIENFDRNFKPYLDEANEIVKTRRKLQSNLRSLRNYFFLRAGALGAGAADAGAGDAVAAAPDSYFALSRNS